MRESLHRLRGAATQFAGLDVLALFGSRATGKARAESDWDFAYLAQGIFDRGAMRLLLAEAVGVLPEHVDLGDLAGASAVLRFEVARDGLPIFDPKGLFDPFAIAAAHQWFDMQPVVEPAYRELLEAMRQ
jgi:predicted nucleotidyltransferase